MRRKGVYSYEYVDSWKKFEETELPPKEAFYSKLNMKGISDADYEHARKVWIFTERLRETWRQGLIRVPIQRKTIDRYP